MARRSRAREVALQLLFEIDVNAKPRKRAEVERFAADRLRDKELAAFALALVDGVAANRQAIDEKITATAENWRLHRINPADRNVLRIALFELLHVPVPEPKAVVLDEAIELARRFGTLDSPGFVNGVLDRAAS